MKCTLLIHSSNLGVHSPSLTGTPQVEAYRPLLLPSILIGESKLGGISTTISAYESLHLRGYAVDAILIFRDTYYKNYEYLVPYFEERGIKCFSFNPPPPKAMDDPKTDNAQMAQYLTSLTGHTPPGPVTAVIDELLRNHTSRLNELDSMPSRSRRVLWWPFVQHGLVKSDSDVSVMDSAYGDYFNVHKKPTNVKEASSSEITPYFDGSASWWTQALGHASTDLTMAASNAAGRYGHVIFPQAVHAPALKLAERLITNGPGKGWASRVFYSDDGSTAMEVALKMALRSAAKRYSIPSGFARKRLGILGLAGSYHGDTIGAMDACQEGAGVYTCEWHDAKGYWIDPPTVGFSDGAFRVKIPESLREELGISEVSFTDLQQVYSTASRKYGDLASRYQDYFLRLLKRFNVGEEGTSQLGAVVLEPLVMGAGGMIFVDPLFQAVMIDTVRRLDPTRSNDDWKGLPVIFDEVFIGFHRLGFQSAAPVLDSCPDISVNAKILTGGLLPMATTLARESIFNTFLSENKADALLHGHSYTAYPVGCAVANKTLDILEKLPESEDWKAAQEKWSVSHCQMPPTPAFSFWTPEFLAAVSRSPIVDEVMALGTLLSIKFKGSQQGKFCLATLCLVYYLILYKGYTSFAAETALADIRSVNEVASASSPTPDGTPCAVHFRTLGNVAYLMGSLNTSRESYQNLQERVLKAIRKP
jgi:dethiobiotin synthetase/adenosylmethionine--8-amino-7-oxononanoate aminotransferase